MIFSGPSTGLTQLKLQTTNNCLTRSAVHHTYSLTHTCIRTNTGFRSEPLKLVPSRKN